MADAKRSLEIGEHLKAIVFNVNSISEDELTDLIATGKREETMGPMIDPTAWRDKGKSEQAQGTIKVLQALLDFKRSAKGIGFFR